MNEKITYGIKNVHYAQKTEAPDGSPIFGAVKAWQGADELSLPPVGDPIVIHADDVEYYRLPVNQGYEGNINVRQIPEDFKTSCLGEYKDANGVLIEKDGIKPDNFALLGEFQIADESAVSAKRFALYDCFAGRPDLSGQTKGDTIDPKLFSVPITARPTKSDGIIKATIKKSDNEALFGSWFDSVYYEPGDIANYVITVTVKSGATLIARAVVVVGGKVGVTNADGVVRISQPAGTYDVLVSATGYKAKTDTVTVASAAVSKEVAMVGA